MKIVLMAFTLMIYAFQSIGQNYQILNPEYVYHYQLITASETEAVSFFSKEHRHATTSDSFKINLYWKSFMINSGIYSNAYRINDTPFFSLIVYDGKTWTLKGLTQINIPDKINKSSWPLNNSSSTLLSVKKRIETTQYGMKDSIIELTSPDITLQLSQHFGIIYYENASTKLIQKGIQNVGGYQAINWRELIPYHKNDTLYYEFENYSYFNGGRYSCRVAINDVVDSASTIRLLLDITSSKGYTYYHQSREDVKPKHWKKNVVFDSVAISQALYCNYLIDNGKQIPGFFMNHVNAKYIEYPLPYSAPDGSVGIKSQQQNFDRLGDTVAVKGDPPPFVYFGSTYLKDKGLVEEIDEAPIMDPVGLSTSTYTLSGGVMNGVAFGELLPADTFTLSLPPSKVNMEFSVYPNPASEMVYITLPANGEIGQNCTLSIYEAGSGRIVHSMTLKQRGKTSFQVLNLKSLGLAEGTYVVCYGSATSQEYKLLMVH